MGKNRTSIKKGEIKNPYGRPPKGYSITEWFKTMLSANPDLKNEIGMKIVEKAKQGDIAALKLVWNYMDGLPEQAVDVTSGKEKINNIKITVVDVNTTDSGDKRSQEESSKPKENNG